MNIFRNIRIISLLVLSLPLFATFTFAGNYGDGTYGTGDYNVGEVIPPVEEPVVDNEENVTQDDTTTTSNTPSPDTTVAPSVNDNDAGNQEDNEKEVNTVNNFTLVVKNGVVNLTWENLENDKVYCSVSVMDSNNTVVYESQVDCNADFSLDKSKIKTLENQKQYKLTLKIIDKTTGSVLNAVDRSFTYETETVLKETKEESISWVWFLLIPLVIGSAVYLFKSGKSE